MQQKMKVFITEKQITKAKMCFHLPAVTSRVSLEMCSFPHPEPYNSAVCELC